MDKLLTTNTGGFPYVLNDLRFVDESVRDAINGILSGFLTSGITKYIVSGCEITEVINGGNTEYTIAAGYIYYSGEIFKVAAHTVTGATSHTAYWAIKTYYDPAGNKTFQDLNSHDTYQKREMELLVSATPPGGYMPKAAESLTIQLKTKLGLDADTWHTVGDSGEPAYNGDWEGVTGEGKRELRFKKTPNNQVHIEGACYNTNAAPVDSVYIFTLPIGYRPANLNAPGTDAIRFNIITDKSTGTYAQGVGIITDDGRVAIIDILMAQNDQYLFNAIIPLD